MCGLPTGGPQVGTNATPDAVVNSHSKEKKSLDDEYIGIIIGALAALIMLLFIVVVIIIIRHRRRKYGPTNQRMKSFEPRHVTLNLNDLRPPVVNGKVVNGNMYNSVATSDMESDKENSLRKINNGDLYHEPFDGIQTRKLPELPKTPESTGNHSNPCLHAYLDLLLFISPKRDQAKISMSNAKHFLTSLKKKIIFFTNISFLCYRFFCSI